MISKVLRYKEYILLFLILILASIVRLYNLPFMVGFDFDQEYAANFAWQVVNVYPIQFIGQGLSVQGLFMGPFYFYYLTPFFFFSNLHPIGGYVGSIILGLITITAYFFLLKNVFNTKVGLIAAFLQAILFTRILTDWFMAPSYSSELAVLIVWFCCYKYWKGSYFFLPLLFFTLGLFTSFHPILFPLYLVVLGIFLAKRKIPSVKIIIFSIIAFTLPLIPLLAFEYFRNFLEVKLLLNLQNTSKGEAITFETVTTYLKFLINYPAVILGLNGFKSGGYIFSVCFYGILGFAFYRKKGYFKERFHTLFFLLTVILVSIYYIVLPLHAPDYYFLAIAVVLFIYGCALFGLIKKNRKLQIFAILIIGCITIINMQKLLNTWNSNKISLGDKDIIVKEIKKRVPKNRDFNVSMTGDVGWHSGFSYLFKLHDIVPQPTSPESPNYIIVVPAGNSKEKIDIKSGDIGLIFPKGK